MTLEIRNLAQGTGWTAHPVDTASELKRTAMTTNAIDLCNICDGPGPLNPAGNCRECDPAGSRDYFDHDDNPLVCGDCARPAYWDDTDANYHHAIDASRGCFLIPADDRPDDPDHPLVAVPGTAWIRTR